MADAIFVDLITRNYVVPIIANFSFAYWFRRARARASAHKTTEKKNRHTIWNDDNLSLPRQSKSGIVQFGHQIANNIMEMILFMECLGCVARSLARFSILYRMTYQVPTIKWHINFFVSLYLPDWMNFYLHLCGIWLNWSANALCVCCCFGFFFVHHFFRFMLKASNGNLRYACHL